MDELLGFIALSGAFFPLILWIPVCLLVAVVVSRLSTRGVYRLLIGLAAFAITFTLPLADEIAGRIYLSYLCKTQGGFKVYHTIELPEKYWDENGDPRFIKFARFKDIPSLDKVNGTLDFSVLPEYGLDSKKEIYSSLFGIRLFRYWYFNKKTNQVLGENRFFTWKGGWLNRTFSANSGVSCDLSGQPNTKAKILSIFVPRKATQ
ncbi:MAG: hypothetical protein WCH04_13420 [Gammaproteobacteria bacterium]